jgi:hypothetical protein
LIAGTAPPNGGAVIEVSAPPITRRAAAAPRLGGTLMLVIALAYFGGLARYGYHRAEDGDILQLIDRTARGQRPYIDFASGYTPLFFYWHAALLRFFGDNLMVIRWSLVLANSLTLWGLYALGRAVMPAAFAVMAPLAYAALMPAVRGEFCAFNIPYPAWYTALFAVVAALALLRWSRQGRPGAAAVAGLAAGLAFSFKPNTGLFVLAGAALVMVCVAAPTRSRDAKGMAALTPTPTHAGGDRREVAASVRNRWAQPWLWWALALGLTGGIIAVFGGRLLDREARVFLWPIFAVVAARVRFRHVSVPNGERLAAGFGASCVTLGLGFAGVTAPWLAYFLAHLGWDRFIHEVLFIGSGYEQHFFLPFHAATRWDYAIVLGAAGGVTALWAVRAGRLRPIVPLALLGTGAAACTAYVGLVAPMPEGFQRAVDMRVRDLSFGLCLLAQWAGVAMIVRAWFVAARRRRSLAAPDGALAVVLALALTMFLGVYPRSDFIHLVISAPLTLVLGALLLSRTAALWSRVVAHRLAVHAAVAVPVLVVSAVILAPMARLWLDMRGFGGVQFVALGVPRAPLVLEEGRRRRVAELRAAVDYLQRATLPSEPIFPFPDLNLLCVLAGRQNPGRVGYFQQGWPGHAVEAEVVRALRDTRPPYVVALHAHELAVTAAPGYHFVTAPAYYFLLREYITAQYLEAARIGPYVILRRRDAPVGPAAPGAGAAALEPAQWDAVPATDHGARRPVIQALTARGVDRVPQAVLAWADSDDPAVQQALAELVRDSGDPAAAAALVAAAPAVTPRVRALFLRVAGEVGDTQAVPDLLRFVDGAPTEEVTLNDLQAVASKALIQQFWLGAGTDPAQGLHGADSPELRERVLAWLRPAQDARLRFFAAWAAGALQERRALPALSGMLREPNADLKGVAGQALSALSPGPQTFGLLLDEVANEPTFLPSLVGRMYRDDPAVSAAIMRQRMQGVHGEQLESLCWIAGSVGDPALAAGALNGLNDDRPATRVAGAWALGEIGGPEARIALGAARADPDRRVRAFAAMAVERLAQRAGLSAS